MLLMEVAKQYLQAKNRSLCVELGPHILRQSHQTLRTVKKSLPVARCTSGTLVLLMGMRIGFTIIDATQYFHRIAPLRRSSGVCLFTPPPPRARRTNDGNMAALGKSPAM
jgi:hypothetical protein